MRRWIKISLFVIGGFIALILGLAIYIRMVAVAHPPHPKNLESLKWERKEVDKNLYTLGNNWFHRSESGLYELYVEGEPFERGVVTGKLTKELVQHQEVVFTDQLHQLVPSEFYLNFLKYFIGWFNRDLEDYVAEENKLEIYGVSCSASHEFDYIASPYQRLLNYHAAHDIGHALQNMALVGCTSFATWGDRSEDSTLIIGRNFDFFVGDQFAEDKIIAFYNPAQGHKFMMVTWGGMTGVLSGMNMEGLTVTINAAKSDIPSGSATPVSLVAREILQYASTIDEAYEIAKKRKMFVAESFLIGSAKDGKAAIIEKTPDGIDRYDSEQSQLVCTNHFQSKTLGSSAMNLEHMQTSASPYRYKKVEELLNKDDKISVPDVVKILRDQTGLSDSDIGRGNEKSINQLVAHHGIVFEPEKKLVWVSTAPWQLGKFICYDLNKIFNVKLTRSEELYDSTRTIPADSFLLTKDYQAYVKFSHYRFPFEPRNDMQPDSLVKWNPNSYHSYMLAGDFYFDKKEYDKARIFYEAGLKKEVATDQERQHMERNLKLASEKLK
jgi:isopenicillin-N N-acyltransferase-like protein